MELQYRRPDGTFVATVNGHPYHVVADDPLFQDVSAAAEELGDALPFDPGLPTPPVTVDDFRRAIQAHVDEGARQRSYDSGITCASYIGSTNPIWAAEAQAFVAWRDAVWAYAYTELAKVEGGTRPEPSVETILGELPALTWPA